MFLYHTKCTCYAPECLTPSRFPSRIWNECVVDWFNLQIVLLALPISPCCCFSLARRLLCLSNNPLQYPPIDTLINHEVSTRPSSRRLCRRLRPCPTSRQDHQLVGHRCPKGILRPPRDHGLLHGGRRPTPPWILRSPRYVEGWKRGGIQ